MPHHGGRSEMTIKDKVRDAGMKVSIAGELLIFLWRRKLWYVIPFIAVLLLLGLVLVLTEGSAVAPIIYTMF